MHFSGAPTITCIETMEVLTHNIRCFSGRRFEALFVRVLHFASKSRRGLFRYDAAMFDQVEAGGSVRRAGFDMQHGKRHVARLEVNMGHCPIPLSNPGERGKCANFARMDSIKLAIQWAAGHPWILLGLLIGIGVTIRFIGSKNGYRRNRASTSPLLRSAREQKRFSHLTTIYNPKGYRRERTPKK